MVKQTSLLAVLVGATLAATGVVAMSVPSYVGHSKILRQVEDVQDEYDYIVVGGGTAGLTVANRLTESGEHTVLVIERGIFANDTSVNTIAGGARAFGNASLYFNFPSEPQENLNDRTTGVIGGLMLGGSSGVNGLQVHRPQKVDVDRWGSYFGNSSEWSWEGLLPYFRKAWQLHPPSDEMVEEFGIRYDESYWGDDSPVQASFPTFSWPFLRNEVDAFLEIGGVEQPVDSGAGDPGVFWYPASVDPTTMTRSFAMREYWAGTAQERDNYETVLGQKVLRVLFDGDTATGVEYVDASATDDSVAQTVTARKEVVMAAGTLYTPQILQASGVGPREWLEAAGVEVIADLPGVGANFQDHPLGAGAIFNFNDWDFHPDPSDLQTNSTFIEEAQAEFDQNRSGPLTIASGNAASFLPFPVIAPSAYESIASSYESQDPGAYLHAGADETLVAGYAAQQSALATALRSPDAAFYNLFLRGSQTEGGSIVFLHPLSRGTVRLDPSDPLFAPPLVDYRALSNPTDLDVQVEFIRFSRRYFTETSLVEFGPDEIRPGANVTSDEGLREAVRASMSPTCFHPVGTAAMMPLELGGVVGQGLEVHGLRGLSVVDASVMPDLPGAYTQQPVYAVAEKAADLIKARA